jgi:uncharacterized protein YdaU (DUF1376 family)
VRPLQLPPQAKRCALLRACALRYARDGEEGAGVMGQIKWYKRDPGAALNGMMELTLEERGAYNTVLDLIYSRDGNLPDDDRFLAGWLRVDVRVWKRIKCNLIQRGKLFVENEQIRNSRADVEVLEALSRVGSAREAGLASARSKASKSQPKSNNNNDIPSTDVQTGVSTTVPTNHNHNHNIYTTASAVVVQNEFALEAETVPKKPELTPEHVVESWNKLATRIGKPQVKILSPERRQKLKARIAGFTVDDFREVLGAVDRSAFLRGDRDWQGCNFDWITKKANFIKILEGNYEQ